MAYIHAFVIAALFVATSLSTPYNQCKQGATPVALRVPGCNALPCTMTRGKKLTAELDFLATSKTNVLTGQVRGTVLGITKTFPFPEKDSCVSLKKGKCPLTAGQKATYELDFLIPSNLPRLKATVEFSFLDDNKKTIVCFKLPVRLQ